MEIKKNDNGKNGAIFIENDSHKIAILTYTHVQEDSISINHTEVNPDFKGQGIANKLIEELVKYARENNLKVIPLCSFASAVFKKNASEYADILVKSV